MDGLLPISYLIPDHFVEHKTIEPVLVLKRFFEGFNRNRPSFGTVCVQVPHDRIERDILLNEETVDIVSDDVVVEVSLPDGITRQTPVVNLLRCSGFEGTNERTK